MPKFGHDFAINPPDLYARMLFAGELTLCIMPWSQPMIELYGYRAVVIAEILAFGLSVAATTAFLTILWAYAS